MGITRFEDIDAWKEARILVRDIYNLFSSNRDFGFRDQIQRAAVSIMANVAEGFERQTTKEFIQFLIIARGSTAEVQSFLYIALDVEYITKSDFDRLYNQSQKIQNLINGFIRYLRNSKR